MEALRNASNAIGSHMVEVEGDREVGVGEAVGLWAAHIALTIIGVNEAGSEYTIGMHQTRPLVYDKEQQVTQEE